MTAITGTDGKTTGTTYPNSHRKGLNHGQNTPFITFKAVVRAFSVGDHEIVALRGIDFTMQRGEMVAIVGPSGAGKSSLLNLLGGLDVPTAGQLSVGGTNLLELKGRNAAEYRLRRVGFVWQNVGRNLLPHRSALRNVMLPMMLSGVGWRERRRRAKNLLEAVSMAKEAHKRPGQLSGGLSYPIHIRRGTFGQAISESASPTDRTSEKVSTPIIDLDGKTLGYLVLSEGPAFGDKIVGDVAEKGMVAAGLAILIAVLVGVVISRSISHPVMVLTEATGRMARGDFVVSIPLQRRDEFGMLAKAFETMARRIESTITTLKQFVADAAHELNTPLTALRTNLELSTAYEMPAQAADDTRQALTELTRLEHLTHSLLVLARLESADRVPTRQPIDIGALICQMVERYASRADQAGIDLESEVPQEPAMVMGDREQLVRVLDNLFDNALKFTPAQGRVSLAIQRDHEQVRLSVRDTGIGIPADDLDRLFSRFHRGRNAAAFPGNGLGLVIAKAIVADHGGRISVDSGSGAHDNMGTCFTITLPAVALLTAAEEGNS